jgi:hypothetical protein
MRYYAFGNYYLSSLQQSLQAHHACQEIYNKHFIDIDTDFDDADSYSTQQSGYNTWSRDHKTIVLLNGGNSSDLLELKQFFKSVYHPYAFASFNEDEQSLNGALTSVCIILPARIYETASQDRRYKGSGYISLANTDGTLFVRPTDLTVWEEELIVRLNGYSLAK